MKISAPPSDPVGPTPGALAIPIFHHYVPRKPLSEFVELFWYWNHAPPAIKERILPAGTVEFVIRLKKDRTHVYQGRDPHRSKPFSGATITGPHSEAFVLDKSEQDELIGVHFKPGGAFPFFGAPADKFLNDHVSLHDVWGKDAESLRSELLETPDVNAKFQVLERRLLEKAAFSFSRHPAVAYVLGELGRGPSTRSLSDLAAEVNLSTRRLTQLFSREVGVTPKLFARIRRFQGAIRILGDRGPREWLDVALESGYYDQAHFNHDFLEFSGMTPTVYREKKIEHLGHVPL